MLIITALFNVMSRMRLMICSICIFLHIFRNAYAFLQFTYMFLTPFYAYADYILHYTKSKKILLFFFSVNQFILTL